MRIHFLLVQKTVFANRVQISPVSRDGDVCVYQYMYVYIK